MQSQKAKAGYKFTFGDFRERFEIPGDWKISQLGDLSKKIKAGGTPKSTDSSFYGGEIPFVSISDISKFEKFLVYRRVIFQTVL